MNTTKTTKQGGEYRVRLFVDGIYQAGADYYTNDKQDAEGTAAHMIANGGISDKTTDFAIEEQVDYNEENDDNGNDLDLVSTLRAVGLKVIVID